MHVKVLHEGRGFALHSSLTWAEENERMRRKLEGKKVVSAGSSLTGEKCDSWADVQKQSVVCVLNFLAEQNLSCPIVPAAGC